MDVGCSSRCSGSTLASFEDFGLHLRIACDCGKGESACTAVDYKNTSDSTVEKTDKTFPPSTIASGRVSICISLPSASNFFLISNDQIRQAVAIDKELKAMLRKNWSALMDKSATGKLTFDPCMHSRIKICTL